MPYATQQDLVDRFGAEEMAQRTDRLNVPPTVIDAVVAGRALDDASAFIDTFLSGRYTLPLSAVPDVLVKICADIARYYLWGEAVDTNGPIAQAYKDASAWLKQVSTGAAKLDADGAPVPSSDGARVQVGKTEFSRDTLRGFI